MIVTHDKNDDTSGSSVDNSLIVTLKITGPLTFAGFVAQIEAQNGRTVQFVSFAFY
jgi:hypothetical protein